MNRANSKNQGKKITIPNTHSQKTTINTLENIKNSKKSKTLENTNKKLSKKILEEKFSKNKMLVALRARPLLPRELEDSNYKTISILNAETVSITIPTEYISSSEKGKYYFNNEKNVKVTKVKEATFKFDFAFDSSADQVEVYQYTTANLVQQVINGYNATVFAYGATGTGKTYTMVGEGEKWGIMVRAISDLFKIINQDKDKEKKFVIKISYVEIYNEIIKDLLADNNIFNSNKPQLEILTDAQKGVVLQGASFKKVTNESDAYKLIMRGNKHRTEKPSTANENSSRSHAILQIYLEVEQQQNSNNINFSIEKTFGKFVLVDLAGSEKAPIFGKKNTESGSINKSLLALGKCITALTSQNKGYIPWRDSKLTRLLQEPLSGNSRIVMIATVSPAISSFDETMFTLQNANKAKGVKVVLKKNVVETEAPRINKYDEYIQNLQEEIHEINEKIVENEKINVNNTIGNTNMNIIMNTSKRDIIEPPKSKDSSNNNLNINIINNNNTIDSTKKNVNQNLSPSKKISGNNTLNNTIQINECEKIQKEIMEHFQTEINLKKKIIEKEEIIENLKNELSEKEYEFYHANKANYKLLKGEVETKREDIKEKTKKMNKGYIKQSELVSKRKEIQASISKLSNNEPNNPQVKNLFHIYRYYLNLLENMNTEHRKFISINEIKRREKKIGILTEQLDLRDMYIRDAYKEIELNKCDFNYKNPKIISSEEIDLAPARPQIVRISPSYGSLQNLSKQFSLPKNDNNETDSKNKLKSRPKSKSKGKDKEKESDKKSNKSSQKYRYSVKSEKYKEMLKEQDSLKKLDEIKKNLVQNTKISKKRQFGNEILGLFKYNPRIMNNMNNNKNGFDINLFERKRYNSPNFVFSQSQTLINAGEKAMNAGNNNYNNNFRGANNLRSKNNFRSNNNSLAKDTRKNYNFRYDGNGNLLRNKNTRNINNNGNYSFSRDDSMSKSTSKIGITNTSSLENEVQKKVKTILKKDYIGRYKRSPYLKLFEQ